MRDSKRVPVEFIDDFNIVAAHYEFAKHGELEYAKQKAREDMDNAVICYAENAQRIRAAA